MGQDQQSGLQAQHVQQRPHGLCVVPVNLAMPWHSDIWYMRSRRASHQTALPLLLCLDAALLLLCMWSQSCLLRSVC